MQSTKMVSKIPYNLWCQVFKYCTIKEFVALRETSKCLQKYADNYTDIYRRECLRIFVSDLQLFE